MTNLKNVVNPYITISFNSTYQSQRYTKPIILPAAKISTGEKEKPHIGVPAEATLFHFQVPANFK